MKQYEIRLHTLLDVPVVVGYALHLEYRRFVTSCLLPEAADQFYTLTPTNGEGDRLLICEVAQMIFCVNQAPYLYLFRTDLFSG
jgi:hypothetical protein